MRLVLVNRLERLNLPRNSVVRWTDRRYMTEILLLRRKTPTRTNKNGGNSWVSHKQFTLCKQLTPTVPQMWNLIFCWICSLIRMITDRSWVRRTLAWVRRLLAVWYRSKWWGKCLCMWATWKPLNSGYYYYHHYWHFLAFRFIFLFTCVSLEIIWSLFFHMTFTWDSVAEHEYLGVYY